MSEWRGHGLGTPGAWVGASSHSPRRTGHWAEPGGRRRNFNESARESLRNLPKSAEDASVAALFLPMNEAYLTLSEAYRRQNARATCRIVSDMEALRLITRPVHSGPGPARRATQPARGDTTGDWPAPGASPRRRAGALCGPSVAPAGQRTGPPCGEPVRSYPSPGSTMPQSEPSNPRP